MLNFIVISLFLFRTEMSVLEKFGPKNQNCLDYFKYAEFNNYIFCSALVQKYLILGKLGPKNQNFLVKIKLGTYIKSNMLNWIM